MASEQFAKRFKNKSNLLGKTGLIALTNINAVEKLEIPSTKIYQHIGFFSPCLEYKKQIKSLKYCPSAQFFKKGCLTPLIIDRNSKKALKRNGSNNLVRSRSPISFIGYSNLQDPSLSKCKELPLKLPRVNLEKFHLMPKAKDQIKGNINRDKYQ